MVGYSPSVAHNVAICSAITSKCPARTWDCDGSYEIKNVSGESSVKTCK
jgi:hypothetical protein